ncbi:type IVB secretion system protein IcmH/DotU [Bartonella sp. LJL80]
MSDTSSAETNEVPTIFENDDFYVGQKGTEIASRKDLSPRQKMMKNMAASQPDFSFPIRGMAINKIIDASSTLIALIMRISSLGDYDEVEDLHKRCRSELDTIILELHKEAYDRSTQIAFSYCMCSFIDETVLATDWGERSGWAQKSLLSIYHQETWGGEKFFIVAERLSDEAKRYIDILEFLYLCMVLGYEGKYRPEHNGKLKLEAFMQEIHDIIRKERGYPPEISTFDSTNIIAKDHLVKWQTPVIAVIMTALIIAIIMYLAYFFYTENYTNGIINDLSHVLKGD